jgi:serine phosphatase RsbU (regulator of sigma subunit)
MPASSATGSATGTGLAGIRVLMVDDDEADVLLVSELFADVGEITELLHVGNLADAATALGGVDCVLLDMNLPDASGLDGLARLRELEDHPAIVVLTGDVDETRGRAAVAAGAEDYLIKGRVDGPLLTRAVQYAVERRHAERLAHQLHEARIHAQENRRLGRGLLPTALLRDPALTVTTRYQPGLRQLLLGGDFYDLIETDDGTVHAIIGDVSGHGPDEAAVGVSLRIAWRTLILAGVPAGHVLPALDRVFVTERHDPTLFTTVAMVSVGPDRRHADLYLAGHPPPLLIDGVTPRPLPDEALGVPLGVRLGTTWPAVEVALPSEWALMLYTDGLIEARDPAGEVLWIDGLVDILGPQLSGAGPDWRADPDVALDTLLGTVDARKPVRGDDLAVALLICTATGTRAGPAGAPDTRSAHPAPAPGDPGPGSPQPEGRQLRRRYEPTPESCGRVRRDLQGFLTRWRVDDDAAESAVLVANELASNAVDHARTPYSLTATLTSHSLRLEVTDESQDEPQLRAFDPAADRGRGLQMVSSLSTGWSFHRHAAGKTVVADLPVTTAVLDD